MKTANRGGNWVGGSEKSQKWLQFLALSKYLKRDAMKNIQSIPEPNFLYNKKNVVWDVDFTLEGRNPFCSIGALWVSILGEYKLKKFGNFWTTRIPTQRTKRIVFQRKTTLHKVNIRLQPRQKGSNYDYWEEKNLNMRRYIIISTFWKLLQTVRIMNQVPE